MKPNLIAIFAFVFSLLIAGCGQSDTETETEAESAATTEDSQEERGVNPLKAPTDYLGAIGQAKKSMEGNIAVTSIQQAVQMFRAENNRNPKSLQELVDSQYLPALPQPPYKMKFQYNPQTGQTAVVPQ